MASCASLLFLAFLLCCSSSSAFNITEMLDQFPDFSSFNSYLTQTRVAGEINTRQTITVLALSNSATSALSGLSPDMVRNVLRVHVVLDYFDVEKLQTLSNRTAILVTLFQASGLATGQTGFLNATVMPWGVALGSAVPGAGLNSNLVNAITTEPYNVSVLQISSVIVPPGIANAGQFAIPPPPPPVAEAAAPTPAVTAKPAPTPKRAPSGAPAPAMTPKRTPIPKKVPSAAPAPTPAAPTPTAAGREPAPPPTSSTPPEPIPFSPEQPLPLTPVGAPVAGGPANGGVSSPGTRLVSGTGLAAAVAAMAAALLAAAL